MVDVKSTTRVLTENDSRLTDSQPLVSVIIPVYNAEKYVEQAVRSIMTQTYKNLEILITDDSSTDGSFAILQRLAEEDPRIKLFKNEQNQKIVRTLNALIERANGKYIARMDADDISLPKRIEKQVAFMESHPDYAMCGTNAWCIDETGRRLKKSRLPISYNDCKLFLKYFSSFYHPTVMLQVSVLKESLYSEDFLYAEDYELWVRLIYKKNLKCANLKENLLKYRIFKNQSSYINNNNQVNAVKKLISKYGLAMDLESHINIFYCSKCVNPVLEKSFLYLVMNDIESFSFQLKLKIYEKIVFYILKSKKYYPDFVFRPMFILTVLFHFMRKF